MLDNIRIEVGKRVHSHVYIKNIKGLGVEVGVVSRLNTNKINSIDLLTGHNLTGHNIWAHNKINGLRSTTS